MCKAKDKESRENKHPKICSASSTQQCVKSSPHYQWVSHKYTQKWSLLISFDEFSRTN